MRLYNFLTEQTDFTQEILAKCKPFLAERKKMQGWAYHGTHRAPGKYILDTNREPRDNSWTVHKFMNRIYKEKVGIPLRSASLFCTLNSGISGTYGRSLCVFPVGQYKVFMNTMIRDAMDIFDDSHLAANNYKEAKIDLEKILRNNNVVLSNTYTMQQLFDPDLIAIEDLAKLQQRTISIMEGWGGSKLGHKTDRNITTIIETNEANCKETYIKYILPIQKELLEALKKVVGYVKQIKFSSIAKLDQRELMLSCKEYFLIKEDEAEQIWAAYTNT